MKYFLSNLVTTEFTTLSFVAPIDEAQRHFMFGLLGDQQIHGVDCSDDQVAEILSAQHQECEVEEVEFAVVEDILKQCRFASEVNAETVLAIRAKYAIDDELKIMKQDPLSTEYVTMMAWIDSCRSQGDSKKVSLGLKQA